MRMWSTMAPKNCRQGTKMEDDDLEPEDSCEPMVSGGGDDSEYRLVSGEPIIPRDELTRRGTSAIIYLAGGALLMVMTVGARFRVFGIALSLAGLIIGVGSILSKDREDKKPGIVILAAGFLGMVFQFGIPLLKPFAGFFLGLGAIGLFAAGIWKGIQFLRGLKSRR